MGHETGCHAVAVVTHAQMHLAFMHFEAEDDFSTLRRVLGRVVEQIGQHLDRECGGKLRLVYAASLKFFR